MTTVTQDDVNYLLNLANQTATIVDHATYTGTLILANTITYNSVVYTVTAIQAQAFSSYYHDLFGLTGDLVLPTGLTFIGLEGFDK